MSTLLFNVTKKFYLKSEKIWHFFSSTQQNSFNLIIASAFYKNYNLVGSNYVKYLISKLVNNENKQFTQNIIRKINIFFVEF